MFYITGFYVMAALVVVCVIVANTHYKQARRYYNMSYAAHAMAHGLSFRIGECIALLRERGYDDAATVLKDEITHAGKLIAEANRQLRSTK